ncbi:hypothetical protein Z945_1221 [Sulfitobacter noctilucae]|uniref:hypothetical protein n=1 Tax=Sulfitobacter noctilucae TaxID=1342302 RepID=UPI00046AB58A|nr:hypothetical protein [Sulfitobacter noctilucae]KIN60253.1 hypothetical protein Z945_1221 [Sulfitobacter noctilucae]
MRAFVIQVMRLTSKIMEKRIPILLIYVLIVCAVSISMQGMRAVETEAGGVELMSAYAWFCALMLFSATYGKNAVTKYWYGALLLCALLARELDMDKAFFESGILSLRHYSGAAPLWQKVIGATVVLGLLLSGILLIVRGSAPFVRGIRNGERGQILILVAICLTVIGKTLDGLFRKLWGVGIEISTKTMQIAQIAEESAELAASLCVMSAVTLLPLAARGRA